MTQSILERYDAKLMEGRDKDTYRNKGLRKTSIKTVYGEVEYSRRVYETVQESGEKACVFLLDKAMKAEKIGLISSNLAEKIAMTITDATYRVTAEIISSTCGQTISHGGVWNFIQRLGEKISEEEKADVTRMHQDQPRGTKEIPTLFEEMDGVWLKMKEPDHKKAPSQEMKVFTMYEGWDKETQRESRTLFDENRISELFDYIQTYADSVESEGPNDKTSQRARQLYQYLKNNEEGLLPYHKRVITIPPPQEGMIHKEMGVQENQNCTLITMRMKHRRMRWGNGANTLAKVMYRKENRKLIETIDKYSDGLITNVYLEEIVETLSAAKAPKKDGKGNPYPDIFRAHTPLSDVMQTASKKAFLRALSI